MEKIGERLKQIRKNKNLTQTAFGEILGVTKQAVANVESCHSNPSMEFLYKLIEKFNVNANWLITGKGEVFIQNSTEKINSGQELDLRVKQILKKARITLEFD